ncbi:hypothetical protein T4B_12901 [Trichinella pseudospiralis]|uniref:Uncharacterized protein n=1 Tax=Trichinella pseudospiralis TaxID=6337 RepID=A0A0V1GJ12_TRIPS|nr:hypothetical protein T4B_12901 [Trichinella pseudospiralis]
MAIKKSPNCKKTFFAIFRKTSKSIELSADCSEVIRTVPDSLFLQI